MYICQVLYDVLWVAQSLGDTAVVTLAKVAVYVHWDRDARQGRSSTAQTTLAQAISIWICIVLIHVKELRCHSRALLGGDREYGSW